jgi:hypothetical protein
VIRGKGQLLFTPDFFTVFPHPHTKNIAVEKAQRYIAIGPEYVALVCNQWIKGGFPS